MLPRCIANLLKLNELLASVTMEQPSPRKYVCEAVISRSMSFGSVRFFVVAVNFLSTQRQLGQRDDLV